MGRTSGSMRSMVKPHDIYCAYYARFDADRPLVRVGHEAVAHAADRLEVAWARRLVFEIPPQPHDEVVDRARVGVLAYAPHLLENRLARHGPAFVLHEIAEQRRLHQRERHGLFPHAHLELLEVNGPLSEREPAGDRGRRRPAIEAELE